MPMEADIDGSDQEVLTVTTQGKSSEDYSRVFFHLVDRVRVVVEDLGIVAERAVPTCCNMYAAQIFQHYI